MSRRDEIKTRKELGNKTTVPYKKGNFNQTSSLKQGLFSRLGERNYYSSNPGRGFVRNRNDTLGPRHYYGGMGFQ